MKPKSLKFKGFTLIELMIVVAIIGLLAAIAIPKFANLVIKAKEAATKGKLGTVRSAVSIYYADNEGKYPSAWQYFAACLTTGGRYLDAIPESEIPTVTPPHRGNGIGQQSFPSDIEFQVAGQAWHFNSLDGRISVNCTHTDSKGTTWSLW